MHERRYSHKQYCSVRQCNYVSYTSQLSSYALLGKLPLRDLEKVYNLVNQTEIDIQYFRHRVSRCYII